MNPQEWQIVIIVAVISLLGSIVGTWAVFYFNKKRLPYQNKLDDANTADIALGIAKKATARQEELEEEILEMREKMDQFQSMKDRITELERELNIEKNRRFMITFVFAAGDPPKVEKFTVEKLPQLAASD